jgi:hypothetical protein
MTSCDGRSVAKNRTLVSPSARGRSSSRKLVGTTVFAAFGPDGCGGGSSARPANALLTHQRALQARQDVGSDYGSPSKS